MKKIISLIVTLAITIGVVPINVLIDLFTINALEAKAVDLPNALDSSIPVWDGTISSYYARGDGSSSQPYIIENGSQLAYLAYNVNNGTDYDNKYFKLISDIDLADYDWTPIGTKSDNKFKGSFDGAGHTIYGLKISVDSSLNGENWGLFGYVNEALLKNITIAEAEISATANNNFNFGILAGFADHGRITNCEVSGNISIQGPLLSVRAGAIGGLVGELHSTTFQCKANVNIICARPDMTLHIGGLAGIGREISQCSSSGSIMVSNSARSVGGLCGYAYGDIKESYSTVSINSPNGVGICAGGLVGEMSSSNTKIVDCYATGDVICSSSPVDTIDTCAGGLVGLLEGGTIERCYAGNNTVTCELTRVLEDIDSYVGKLVGLNRSTCIVKSSYVNSNMTVKRSYYVPASSGCGSSTEEKNETTNSPSCEIETGTFTYGSNNPKSIVGWGTYDPSNFESAPWIDSGNNPTLYSDYTVSLTVLYLLDNEVFNINYEEVYPGQEASIVSPTIAWGVPDKEVVSTKVNSNTAISVSYTHVHVPGEEATCTSVQTCTMCGFVLAEKKQHSYEAIQTILPTCTDNGCTVYSCSVCGDIYNSYTIPDGHKLDNDFKCIVCGEQFDSLLRNYVIYVYDNETGKPIEGANVTLEGTTTETDVNGAAKLQLKDCDEGTLIIKKESYPDYTVTGYVLNNYNTDYIYLTSDESGIHSAWCNGENVLVVNSQINNKAPGLVANILVVGSTKANIKKYELVQDNQVISTSYNGSFKVRNLYFKQNVPVFARMYTDGQNDNIYERKLNISVVGFSCSIKLDDLFPFSMGTTIDFTDDSPLFGGVSLDIPAFCNFARFKVNASNNKIVFSLGLEEDFSNDDLDNMNLREIFEKLRDKFIKQNDPEAWTKGKTKSEVSLSAALVLEIGNDSKVTAVYAEALLGYELAYKWGKTFLAASVPVYAGFKAGLKGELILTELGYDFENAKPLIPDVEFELNAEIAAYAGLGCSYISTGFYGAVGGGITLGIKDYQEYYRYLFYGQMGIYARIDPFFFDEVEYRIPLLHGDVYGPNGQVEAKMALLSLESYQPAKRNYLNERSDWMSTSLYSENGDAYTVLQTNSYSALNPEIVVSGDTIMMLFMDDDGSEGYNYQHLYYSLFDKSTNTWNAPIRVDNLAYADLEFDVYADDNGIWLAYTKAGDITADNKENYSEIMSSVEVYTARYDFSGKEFIGHSNISNNDTFDSQPQIIDGAVIWVNNFTNDGLAQNANNVIFLSEYTENSWKHPVVLDKNGATVTSVDFGYLDDAPCIALIRDVDCDLSTETDRRLELVNIEGEVIYVKTEQLTNEGVRFVRVNGQNAIQWYNAGTVWQLNSANATSVDLLGSTIQGLNGKYKYVPLENNSAVILYSMNSMENKVTGSSIYAIYYSDGVWGEPVPITEFIPDTYIDFFDSCSYNGKLLTAFLSTEATVTETEISRNSNFVTSLLEVKNDLTVDKITFLESELFNGSTIDINIQVSNMSCQELQGVSIKVVDDTDALVYEQELHMKSSLISGQSDYVSFTLPKEKLHTSKQYNVLAFPLGWEDDNISNNQQSINLWYTDFDLMAQQILLQDKQQLQYAITNYGNVGGDGKVLFYQKTGDVKTVLFEEDISLGVGETCSGMFEIAYSCYNEDYNGIIYAEVIPNALELYNFNNKQSLSILNVNHTVTEDVTNGSQTIPAPVVNEPYVVYDKYAGQSIIADITENGWLFAGITELSDSDYSYTNGQLLIKTDYLQTLDAGYHYYTLCYNLNEKTAQANLIIEIVDNAPLQPSLTAQDVTVEFDGSSVELEELDYKTSSEGEVSVRYDDGSGWKNGLPTDVGQYIVELSVAEDTANNYDAAKTQFVLSIIAGHRAISAPSYSVTDNWCVELHSAQPTAGIEDGTVYYGYSLQNNVETVIKWSENGILPFSEVPTVYFVFAKIANGKQYKDAYSVGYAIDAHVHNYVAIEVPPTTFDEGYTRHVCSFCNDEYRNNYTDKLDFILGDVNDDGYIDNLDAAIILKYDAGIIDLTASVISLADVNDDGCADNLDASIILKYDAGIIDSFNLFIFT